jgi:hypothetical protein
MEDFKSILMWDQFYKVVFDITNLLPKINNRNQYILVAIDHYFKWVETKVVVDHDMKIVARFFEDEIICQFRVFKHLLTYNGGEWVV